jgi:hypothetical protein
MKHLKGNMIINRTEVKKLEKEQIRIAEVA